MKRLLLCVAWCLLGLSLSAQTTLRCVYWFDENYSTRITDSITDTNGHLLIETRHLRDGFHTLYMQLDSGITARLQNFMFYLPPQSLVADSFDIDYTYWFDESYNHHYTGNLGNGYLLLDCNNLRDGFHTLYMQLGTGTSARLQNFMFYLPPQDLVADSFDIHYTYWFDNNYYHHYSGTLTNGHLLIDADSLREGFHTLYMQLGTGTTARLQNFMFLVPPQRFVAEYTEMVYWFGDESTVHHLSPMAGTHLIAVPPMTCGEEGLIHLMAMDSNGNTSPVLNHTYVWMDSSCCLPPLFVTADNVTDTGARLHWDYNRPESYTLVWDTLPFTTPDSSHNMVVLTDTTYWFSGMHAGITCYYAIKTNCDTSDTGWVRGEWTTVCRTLTPYQVDACDSYAWRGDIYTESGTYRDTVPTSLGYAVQCDSIYELNLSMHHSFSTEQTVTACRSYDWHGRTLTESTDTATYHTHTVAGCDSTVTLHLTVNHSTHPDLTERDTACGRYRWHERTYTESGAYTQMHVYDDSPCPGIDTLHLVIRPEYHTRDEVAIFAGDSVVFGGQAYRTAGVYEQRLLSVYGCDSVKVLVLRIEPVRNQIARATVCQGEPYSNGQFTVTAAQTATAGLLVLRDTLRTARGFDSLIRGLDLTVLPNNLAAVASLEPATDSVITRGDVVLRWGEVAGATGYRVYLWTTGQAMPATPTYVTTNTYQHIPFYQNRQTYNWKVEAYNPCDTTAGAIQHFLIYKEPSMTLSSHALAFGEVEYNASAHQSLTISGRDLTDSIRLAVRGTDSAMFALSAPNLDRFGGTVTVAFSPTVMQRSFDAYLTVTGGTTRDTVALSGLMANYYQFTVSVADSILPANTPVVINGTLENAAQEAQANVAVDVYVKIMGQTYLYTDTTDALGHFGATYTPVPSECGYYEVGACLHGSPSRRTMAEFNIPGISILTDVIQWMMEQNDTITGDIPVRNRSNVTLHNITVAADSLPSGVSVQFDPLTLSPFETANLHYTLVGSQTTIGNEYENAHFTATCTEGSLGSMYAYYYCYAPVPDLEISFDTIVCAAVPGTQKVVDVVLYNNTDSTFSNVSIQTPAGFTGIQLLHVDSTYTIAPHDTLYVPLLVMLPEGTPLAPLSGDILVTADGTASQFVPFIINVVSDAKGSLRVLVSNEYTYAYGTHVSNAHVVVVGYYSLDTVAAATTDSTGMLIFDSLPEGYYNLYVDAPDNDNYAGVIQIRGSRQTFQEVHLEYQAVTYTLEVNQTSVGDEYTIDLVSHYKTNVPKPVVTIEVPRITVPFDGSFATFNIIASNHGLIDCYDAVLTVPTSQYYEFVPLYDRIDTLKAMTSIAIPCAVRNKYIYNTVMTLDSLVVDTIYKERTRTETRVRYRDTLIYVPISYWIEETTYDTITVIDTIGVPIPHVEYDTVVDSIVERIIWYDTTIGDTVFTISADLEPLYGNCETHPFKLMAQWRCSEGGKWVFAGTTTEKIDCTHSGEDLDSLLNGLADKFMLSTNSGNNSTDTIRRMRLRDRLHARLSSLHYYSNVSKPLPHINWPNIPKKKTDWDCQPCWYKATVDAIDCGGYYSQYPGNGDTAGSSQNDADRYRNLRSQWGSAVWSGNPVSISYALNLLNSRTEQTSIRILNQASYIGQQSANNMEENSNMANEGSGTAVFHSAYGEAALQALSQLLGADSPLTGPLALCADDLFAGLTFCGEGSEEIPWGYNVHFNPDTNVNLINLKLSKSYYDTIKSIRERIVYDTIYEFNEHPEVLISIVRRLVTGVIPTVQQLRESYDTTIIEIDTIILRHYIERWRRTGLYYERGWLNPSMVPSGYSLDFFYLDTNTTGALERMELTAMDEGYWSIEELYTATLDSMVSYPKKKSVCAGVALQFNQSIAMTREAFEGRLVINNPHDSVALRDLSLLFSVSDTLGHDCSNMFDIQIIGRQNVDSLGTLAPNSTGSITVRYVPLMSAAPMAPVPYLFGGSIDYTDPFTAAQMSDELKPVKLTVHPSPHLQIDYFVTHNIIADDPLTLPVIEPSVPATIGLRVLNNGAGSAQNVRISSLSPHVVDNRQGLVVNFTMLNSMMNGVFCSQPLSDIELGTVQPDEAHTLEYLLKSSLLGTITVDNVNVIHNSSINDRDMSLVSARAHSLVKTVMEYRPGSDTIHDFLTNDGGLNRPDTIYFSSGRSVSVAGADTALFDHYVETMNTVTLPDSTVEVTRLADTVVRLTVYPDTIGWQYASTDDPGEGKYDIVSCVRDDSVSIPLDNIWLTFVDLVAGLDPEYNNRLHIVDTLTVVRPTSYNVTFRLKEDMLKVEKILDIPVRAIDYALDTVRVQFNQPIIDTTFTYADMSLKCNNGVELMDSTVTVSRVDDTTYSVHLASKTNAFGLYVLKVMADSIRNADGHFGAGGREAHWVRANCTTVKDSIAQVACDNFIWRDSSYTATGIYTDTLSQMAGCDSILLLNLTINHSTTAIETVTACDSYTWHDSTYTTSTLNSQFSTLNSVGCDSTVTLNLTINYSTTGTETITACDNYTWHDSTYTTSTFNSQFSTLNSVGCDSTVTLHLTINYNTSAIEDVSACDSYTWHDSIYSTSTIDSITLTNAAGCDSTVTLYLTINYSSHTTIVDTATNSYEWNGEVLTESGEYVYEGQTEAGCDSIVTLKLTINHVGIADVVNPEGMSIYPNPTSGKLTIVGEGVTKVEVFDQNGRIADTFLNANEVDISHLPTGAYTLRITLHNGTAVKRVIKQ